MILAKIVLEAKVSFLEITHTGCGGKAICRGGFSVDEPNFPVVSTSLNHRIN